jgi:KaiC/GvpD/RAD55 family RecA-like ATPase
MEYRIYLRHLFQKLEKYNSINLILGETEQEPNLYSRTGVEEFLVDGVFVLYNIRKGIVRQRALEILKLRCSNHVKKLVPYQITNNGIELFPEAEVFV